MEARVDEHEEEQVNNVQKHNGNQRLLEGPGRTSVTRGDGGNNNHDQQDREEENLLHVSPGYV